ncbi:hypothetical protein K438DRAFT_1980433 [Mycena galopus ATCC 62051]|nr:hypothetical protein K438DRAFT_1980433 [Mycena galopus ATCC 62051]
MVMLPLSPHLTSVAPRSLAVVSPPDVWWTFDARHRCNSAQVLRFPMSAFTAPSESYHPGAEARLDVAVSTYGFLSLIPFFSPSATLPSRPLHSHISVPSSCVLQDLFLVFLIGNEEQTLEARPSQFFHPAMSQVRLSGPVETRVAGADAT